MNFVESTAAKANAMQRNADRQISNQLALAAIWNGSLQHSRLAELKTNATIFFSKASRHEYSFLPKLCYFLFTAVSLLWNHCTGSAFLTFSLYILEQHWM